MSKLDRKMNGRLKIVILGFITLVALTSCYKPMGESSDSSDDFYVVNAANAYAIENETEIETLAPTEEHRPVDESFIIRPAREIVIGERPYMTSIKFIYNHIDDFLESHIIVEGMYGMYYSWDETFISPMVYRNGPGDYGDDRFSGFYIEENPDYNLHLNDWIRVKGTPYMHEHVDSDGEAQKYMFLKVESLEVLSTRERKSEMVND